MVSSIILFKNADNGSGTVDGECEIRNHTCISWHMSPEKLDKVCEMLADQLTPDYTVCVPESDDYTITLHRIGENPIEYIGYKHFITGRREVQS